MHSSQLTHPNAAVTECRSQRCDRVWQQHVWHTDSATADSQLTHSHASPPFLALRLRLSLSLSLLFFVFFFSPVRLTLRWTPLLSLVSAALARAQPPLFECARR